MFNGLPSIVLETIYFTEKAVGFAGPTFSASVQKEIDDCLGSSFSRGAKLSAIRRTRHRRNTHNAQTPILPSIFVPSLQGPRAVSCEGPTNQKGILPTHLDTRMVLVQLQVV